MQPPWHTNIKSLQADGFVGFQTIGALRANKLSRVPGDIGVYIVAWPGGERPTFLERSTGGFFKVKDPSVRLEMLSLKWVEGAQVLYVGKAGSLYGSATLRSRLRQRQ
jgi:hypothetical protein